MTFVRLAFARLAGSPAAAPAGALARLPARAPAGATALVLASLAGPGAGLHAAIADDAIADDAIADDETTDDAGQPAETLDDVGRELAETAARLAELDTEIAAGRELRLELEAAVADAESQAGERRERVAGLAAEIARFETALAGLEVRVTDERADIEVRRERLARTLRDTRHVGTATGLRTLLGHDDPALAGRLSVYADYALIAQRRAIGQQAAVLAKLEAARDRTLKDRNWLEHIKRKASGQRDARVAEGLSRSERLASVDGELAAKTRSVAELTADRERLQTLMDELEALQSSASGYFAAGKGSYGWPVDGRVDAHFGDLKSVGKIRWTGLFMAADEGTPVRSVADGEVVYADRLRGFGLLVVIDHGDDYMTLYGGNRAVTREVGDWVEAGANIATVGESGGQSESGVYFEVRAASEPLDPELWLASRATTDGAGDGRIAGR